MGALLRQFMATKILHLINVNYAKTNSPTFPLQKHGLSTNTALDEKEDKQHLIEKEDKFYHVIVSTLTIIIPTNCHCPHSHIVVPI